MTCNSFFFCAFATFYLSSGTTKNRNGAKFCWKRIPTSTKQDPELSAIWKIGQAMWKKNYVDFYKNATQFNWSAVTKTLVESLIGKWVKWKQSSRWQFSHLKKKKEKFRNYTFHLIAKAYTTISIADASIYFGLPAEQTVACNSVTTASYIFRLTKFFLPFNTNKQTNQFVLKLAGKRMQHLRFSQWLIQLKRSYKRLELNNWNNCRTTSHSWNNNICH